MSRSLALAFAVALAAAACRPKTEPAAPPTPPAAAPAADLPSAPSPVVAIAEAPSPVAAPAAPSATEADVRQLLDAWQKAQNEGAYSLYASLYANRMTGIRRVGHVARGFGKAAWLADRKRMFGRAMQVGVADVRVTLAGATPQVRFTQTFETGNFKDTGEKVLTLVNEAGQWRIAKEEMLTSTVLDGQLPPQPVAPEQAALVIQAHGQTWLTLGTQEIARAEGKAEAVEIGSPAVAKKALPAAHQPKGWLGRDVVVYAATGKACEGQVAEVAVLARVVPHFAQVQEWQDAKVKPAASEIALQIWDLGADSAVVAARVKPYDLAGNDAACTGALFGRAATLPPPVLLGRDQTKAGAMREAGLAAMRAEAAYLAIGRDFVAEVEPPRPVHWDQFEHSKAEVTGFEGHGQRLVVTHAKAGGGCGGFFGEYLAVWLAQPGQPDVWRLQLASQPKDGADEVPQAAVDVDGDGVFELLSPSVVWRRQGATWRPWRGLNVPNYDCPC